MRKTEQRLWDRMRKHVPQYGVLLKRIENIVEAGTPDVHGGANNVNRWCELKAIELEDLPTRPSTRMLSSSKGLRLDQENWHIEQRNHRCVTYIIVGVGGHEAFVHDNSNVERFNDYTYAQMKEFCIIHIQQPSDWRKVAVLFGAKP